ncbi:MAG: 16S rRNA (uracil(1498)-N(3))-methyltransferase [Deltaproteobacteria bacterium]|nr:MAG: 16S rRNA (uracil(1498)-N(3))-methyltransferase [Deltaproteobacteria bacterium]
MPTFFVDRGNISGDTAVLSGTEAGHMLRSLRLRTGDSFYAFDEVGNRYRMRILEATSRSLRAEVLESFPPEPPPEVAVTLLVGLPKADKMDFILEKATELGCSRVIPFRSSRTIPRLDARDAGKRLLRWERIALAAAKQCGSGRAPDISPLLSFPDALRAASAAEGKVLFYEGEGRFGLKKVLGRMAHASSVALLIGPEGGFSEDEVKEAEGAGFLRAGLGARILRVETAAVAALGMTMYHFEKE